MRPRAACADYRGEFADEYDTAMAGGGFTQRAVRLAAALLAVGVVTALYRAVGFANATTIALGYLLVVLGVAASWGLGAAIAASVAATLCFNFFFLPPVGTWTIADAANWVALLVFLVVAVVASQLSERARKNAEEAREHQEETERLYSLSRMILMLGGSPAQVAGEAPRLVRQIFGATAVALYHTESGQIFQAGEADVPLLPERLREIALQGALHEDGKCTAMPVTLGGKSYGACAVAGVRLSDGARQAIANLLAIALESAAVRELSGRAELVRHSEEFKATLLDALAHELKTPLTSLKAALSAVPPEAASAANLRDLLAVAEEETDRLNRLISEVLQMARLEAGKLRLSRKECAIGELITSEVEAGRRLLGDREVYVSLPPDLPAASADAELVPLVLRCLLDNAAKYSAPGKPIRISATRQENQVLISVTDEGPGLTEAELALVFEKYYRGAGTRDTVPGLGMGLAVARDIVAAHGGRMWAESAPGQGSRFSFTLPLATETVGA